MELKDGFCVVNGMVVPSSSRLLFSSKQVVVYEVIRLIGGTPLFFQEHFWRLKNSCQLANLSFQWEVNQVKQVLKKLIVANGADNINLKIEVCKQGSELFYQMMLIPSLYPTEFQYKNGVKIGLLHAERNNPNAKVLNRAVRSRADEMINSNHFYEVLLVNNEEEVTEGSRSNFFLVGESSLLTSSLNSVLPGITRQMVVRLASELNIEVVEAAIPVSILSNYPAAFLTGTSPGLIAISKIDTSSFSTIHPTYLRLRDAYNKLVIENLSLFSYDGNK